MTVIPVFISSAVTGFDDERAVLGGPVRDALSALVAPYACSVEYVETPSDDAVFVGLVSGEPPSAPAGTWMYFVRADAGDVLSERHNAVAGYPAPPSVYVYERAAADEDAPIPDLSEFETLAVDVLSVAVVGRAWATSEGRRPEVRDDPVAALELAITLQRIGDVAQGQDDAISAKSAYDESLAILGELPAEDPKVQAEIEFLEFLLDDLDRMERRWRDSREHTAGGPPFAHEDVGTGARVTSRAPAHRGSSRWWTQPAEGGVTYSVWFGTNRMPRDEGDLAAGFRDGRDDEALHLGRCEVHVPESHRFGSVGKVWWKSWLRIGKPDEPLRLEQIQPARSAEVFLDALRGVLSAGDAENRILVYLHGFNTSFEEAAIRAAQLGCDLKYPGAVAFFSWPSHGDPTPDAYAGDTQRAAASEARFIEYLTLLSRSREDVSIDILVHSLGNQVFAGSVERMLAGAVDEHVSFGTVILAAPDIDVAFFRQIAPFYGKIAPKTTMYISTRDLPLRISGKYQRSVRAGYSPPVTVVEGIDTIEVSAIDFSLLGHGYYGSAHAVLHDMHALLQGVRDPARRLRLAPAKGIDGAAFWRFTA